MSRVLKELEHGLNGQLRCGETAVYFDEGANPAVGALLTTIPAGSRYRVVPRIKEAFNAGSSNTMTVGVVGTVDAILADAVVLPEATGLKAASDWFYTAAALAIYAYCTATGTVATAGEARFYIEVIEQVV
jgi:hypothetical protein